MHPQSDTKNLILAAVISTVILVGWSMFFEKPLPPQPTVTPTVNNAAPAAQHAPALVSREAGLGESPRVKIISDQVTGTIALKGLVFDDLTLAKYHQTIDKNSAAVTLLSPDNTKESYFALTGWTSADSALRLPDANTLWQANGTTLTPEKPLNLTWNNGQGLTFTQEIALDKQYLFTITQSVKNTSGKHIALAPYGYINRIKPEEHTYNVILHEGPLGVMDGTLKEVSYSDMEKEPKHEFSRANGWFGITDKYWLTALIPSTPKDYKVNFSFYTTANSARYQVDYLGNNVTLAHQQEFTNQLHFFAGAKEFRTLDAYATQLNAPLFDRAVDLGVLHLITKPIFLLLNFFYDHIQNFGICILLLTVVIKLCMFPLANKSFKAMARMKHVQPEMVRLKEKHKDDPMKFQQELMAFYKKEKINPASGCLPMLIQIPVFFALYKVLYVTIEMRHAPFYGWVHDLSAADPTNIFTLFGLIAWTTPTWLHLGAWPILMSISYWLMQKMGPQPTDATQAMVMKWFPVMFLFICASFPAGLVIYWTWSNILTILQQWVITREVEKVK